MVTVLDRWLADGRGTCALERDVLHGTYLGVIGQREVVLRWAMKAFPRPNRVVWVCSRVRTFDGADCLPRLFAALPEVTVVCPNCGGSTLAEHPVLEGTAWSPPAPPRPPSVRRWRRWAPEAEPSREECEALIGRVVRFVHPEGADGQILLAPGMSGSIGAFRVDAVACFKWDGRKGPPAGTYWTARCSSYAAGRLWPPLATLALKEAAGKGVAPEAMYVYECARYAVVTEVEEGDR